MYRTILAAVNEHVNSEIAGRYAKHLARITGARLLVCSVREPGQSESSFELARETSRRVQHAARDLGVETECLFREGNPVSEISDVVRNEGVDLAVIATRRQDVHRRFGRRAATTRKLLFKLPCSVALVRVVHLGRIHPSEILMPIKERIDDIPSRAYFAAMMAKAFDAKIHLFHVTRPMRKFFQGEQHLTPVEWDEKSSPDLARLISHLDGYQVQHEKRLTPGKAAKSIAIEAAARRRDLIIMGASKRGLLDLLLRGNPVEEVLRETPCNLIILRTSR